jgi:hypothetical protein
MQESILPGPAVHSASNQVNSRLKLANANSALQFCGPVGELLLGFQEVCSIEIDLSAMRSALRKVKLKSRGCCEPSEHYWVLSYRIAFMFGSTEIRAFVVWTENGETKRGPATLIPISRAL